jgi:glycosyltransferase involved in cell wall biosynthesis
VPAYNGSAHIRECLDSALAQDYPHIEIIVVDDGSDDDTAAIVQEHEAVRLIQQQRQGAGSARNTGLAAAKGDYVKFLDADDVLVAGAIRSQVEFVALLGKRQIGYGFSESFSRTRIRTEKRPASKAHKNPVVDTVTRVIRTSWPLHPVAAVRSVGGYDCNLQSGQERHLHFRMALRGFEFVPQDVLVYRRRIHKGPDRISNRPIKLDEAMESEQIWLKSFEESRDQPVKNLAALRQWQMGRSFLAKGETEAAHAMFKRARHTSPYGFSHYFTPGYKVLFWLFGPLRAEQVVTWNRKRKGLIKK